MFGVCAHGYLPAVCPVCTAMMNQALAGPMFGFPMTNPSYESDECTEYVRL
jgi:hypothetical protein